ncbi:DUF1192 domain-containing protein [Pacificimonas sp. ICDLI1SI03]|jgi:uncharacterized small protein (DUF1192 family)|tara:strand:- start:7592 stop:7783 length:192 start_codon:yes stop_codon:yes gene_type:complete
MDEDDLPRPGDPLATIMKQDLDPLSVHELEARIAALETEIERTRQKLTGAKDFKASAAALFGN